MSSGSWWARHTCSIEPRMMRETRTWVSDNSWASVARPAANDARSVMIASIWPMASVMPSSMPMASSCSSASADGKWVVVGDARAIVDGLEYEDSAIDGIAVFSEPSSFAKLSRTSKHLAGLHSEELPEGTGGVAVGPGHDVVRVPAHGHVVAVEGGRPFRGSPELLQLARVGVRVPQALDGDGELGDHGHREGRGVLGD